MGQRHSKEVDSRLLLVPMGLLLQLQTSPTGLLLGAISNPAFTPFTSDMISRIPVPQFVEHKYNLEKVHWSKIINNFLKGLKVLQSTSHAHSHNTSEMRESLSDVAGSRHWWLCFNFLAMGCHLRRQENCNLTSDCILDEPSIGTGVSHSTSVHIPIP